jgi:WD40 repeat protein
MRLWPFAGDLPAPSRELLSGSDGLDYLIELAGVPDGSRWAVSSSSGQVAVVTPTGEMRRFKAFSYYFWSVATSPDGRLVAAGGVEASEAVIRVFELATGRQVAVLDANDRQSIHALAFVDDGTLVSAGPRRVRIWEIRHRTSRTLWEAPNTDSGATVQFVRAAASRWIIFAFGAATSSAAYVIDLGSGLVRHLDRHGDLVTTVAIDGSGEIIATGSLDGVVRVGRADGTEPHLLLGLSSGTIALAISPTADAVASGGQDGTVHLWPMPDLSKPPAHTLPLPELLAKLKSQTNLRVVADPAAPGGYRTEPGPFPGWALLPEWEP